MPFIWQLDPTCLAGILTVFAIDFGPRVRLVFNQRVLLQIVTPVHCDGEPFYYFGGVLFDRGVNACSRLILFC